MRVLKARRNCRAERVWGKDYDHRLVLMRGDEGKKREVGVEACIPLIGYPSKKEESVL